MVLKRIAPLSVGKVFAIVQGVFGLIVGAFFALFGLLGAAAGADDGPGGVLAVLFGGAAVVIVPVCYAILGFVGGVISAWVYNIVAGAVGGVEIVLE